MHDLCYCLCISVGIKSINLKILEGTELMLSFLLSSLSLFSDWIDSFDGRPGNIMDERERERERRERKSMCEKRNILSKKKEKTKRVSIKCINCRRSKLVSNSQRKTFFQSSMLISQFCFSLNLTHCF